MADAHRAGRLVERTSGQKCDCGAARPAARSSVTAWERWPEQPQTSAETILGCAIPPGCYLWRRGEGLVDLGVRVIDGSVVDGVVEVHQGDDWSRWAPAEQLEYVCDY